MKKNCTACKGGGLALPLCDAPCIECDGRGYILFAKKVPPTRTRTSDEILVDQLLEIESLSDWKITFAKDLDAWTRDGTRLTTSQREVAEKIVRERQ